MKTHHSRLRTISVVCLAALAAGVTARANHTVDDIPLSPHGDALSFSAAALPLTPTSFVTEARGDDNQRNTPDDKLLIVTGVGGTPTVTATVVGALPPSGGRLTRLSATRALHQGAGADGAWKTGDEELLIIDQVGSGNVITRVVIGSMQTNRGALHVPSRLTPDSVVVAVLGADNTVATADDAVALVTDIGGTPTVTRLPAPFLSHGGRTRPAVLSPTSFLIASVGPDGEHYDDDGPAGSDDLVYLFTDVGGTNTRTSLAVPDLHFGRPGQPVRITSTMAVTISAGPDHGTQTADDRVYLFSDLGGANTVTWFELSYLSEYAACRPRVLGPDLLAISTWGVDGNKGTVDDTVAFISNLAGTPAVTHVVVGAMNDNGECRPARLTGNRAAVVTFGPDTTNNNADDRIAIVSDIGGADTLTYAGVPGLMGSSPSELRPLSSTGLLVYSGGADGAANSGGDDVFTVVTGIGTATPVVASELLSPAGSGPFGWYAIAARPTYAGDGRAIALSSGPDGAAGDGGDDTVQVIAGLPQDRALSTKKLQIKFKATKPQKGEKFVVKADLTLDDPALFGMGDLTISIGNAAETIPADAFVEKRGKPTYKRPKGGTGFIKKVVYNPKKGTLSVTGKGVGTGAETTAAGFIPFTLEIPDVLFLGETLVGEAKKFGLKYKRP